MKRKFINLFKELIYLDAGLKLLVIKTGQLILLKLLDQMLAYKASTIPHYICGQGARCLECHLICALKCQHLARLICARDVHRQTFHDAAND